MQEAIIKQFQAEIKKFNIKNNSISSIFIGGGTPSAIQAKLYKNFFSAINPYLEKNAEITVEANPNITYKNWLLEMQDFGVNRISFGVQSFDLKKLTFLGRNHTKQEAISSILNAEKVGYKNISIDLIYGTHLDSKKNLKNDVEIASSLPINHVSAYSLSVEKNTPFYAQKNVKNDSIFLDNFFHNLLKNSGFNAYEVSNFEKGYKCKHNIGYWEHKKYIGIGSGAVGFDGKNRFYCEKNPVNYIQNPTLQTVEKLTKNDVILEKIFLGLRSFIGIKLKDLPLQIKNKVDFLVQEKKLFIKNGYVFNLNYSLSDEIALFLVS